ncbi:hypothetical protein BDQ17DRAFT_679576 [Cyathus striatus]|nr:hypothetical protein BDQ17DRAFT_679576 [Cyathus striatus]
MRAGLPRQSLVEVMCMALSMLWITISAARAPGMIHGPTVYGFAEVLNCSMGPVPIPSSLEPPPMQPPRGALLLHNLHIEQLRYLGACMLRA